MGDEPPGTMRVLRVAIPTHQLLEGGGFPVRRPAAMGREMSPFLLLDEMGPVDWPPGDAIGAPAHPHRGFETVTYLLQGRMCHGDSAGHAGELGPGDVQWMTAGRGVIHEELPHPDFKREGGVMHGFQIWVNLPAESKMMQPRYQDVPGSEIPLAKSDDGLVEARVVAGESLGVSAVIDTVIPIIFIHLIIRPGGSLVQPVQAGLNAMLYCFGGAVLIGTAGAAGAASAAGTGDVGAGDESAGDQPYAAPEQRIMDGQLGLFTDGESVRISVAEDADEPAEMLLLAGQPIDEPIARYGPFVMNTEAEIQQALDDYHAGRLA